ncbi:MAG: T9SS type A sorting domain-containing protein, partial [Pedobacter sp.]
GLLNDENTTEQLTSYFVPVENFPFSGGKTMVNSNNKAFSSTIDNRYEFEFVLEPTPYMDANKVYRFRIANNLLTNYPVAEQPSLLSPAVTYARVVSKEIYNYNTVAATATLKAEVTLENGSPVTARGFVYSTSNQFPTLADTQIIVGDGLGVYTSQLTGIAANQVYYVRSYATNSIGTSYGAVKVIQGSDPSVTTATPAAIKTYSADLGGNALSIAGSNPNRGVIFSSIDNDVSFNSSGAYRSENMGQVEGSFFQTVSSLLPNTTYYARAYALHDDGISYGEVVTFTTKAGVTSSITSSAGLEGETTGTNPIPFTITFSESVTNFDASDISVYNGTVSDFSGSGTTYTFNVTPTLDGLVEMNLSQSAAASANGEETTAAFFYIRYVAVLPVDLLDFTAKAENNSAKLQWTTSSETNNDHFVIERAANGGNFQKLTTVTGKGTTTIASSYIWFDRSPVNGTNYYRLKQVDKNGVTKDLGDRSLSFQLADSGAGIYPNPVVAVATVTFPVGIYQQVELSDLNGKVLLKQPITKSAEVTSLNLATYPKGVYLLKLSGNATQEVIKVESFEQL